MADSKISGLAALTEPPSGLDEFPFVDKSDTSMAGTGTNKKITADWLLRQYTPEAYGAVGDGVTDDTTAWRNMMDAIQTAGTAADVVLTMGKKYLLNGTPTQTKSGNAVVPLPLKGGSIGTDTAYPFPPQCLDVRIRSIGKGNATIMTTRTGDTYMNGPSTTLAAQLTAGATSATLTSAAAWPTSGTFKVDNEWIKYTGKSSNTLTGLTRGELGTTDATHTNGTALQVTYGAPSILGGPTPEGTPHGFFQSGAGNLTIEGVLVQVPTDPEIGGIDAYWTQTLKIDGLSICCPEGAVGTQVAGPANVTVPTHPWAFGLRTPNGANQGGTVADDVYISTGPYVGIVLGGSHNRISASIQFVKQAYGVSRGIGNGAEQLLPFTIISDVKYGFAGWNEVDGAYSLSGTEVPVFDGFMLMEGPADPVWDWTNLLLDANNKFKGQMKFMYWALALTDNLPPISGGANFNFRRPTHEYLHSAKGLKITGKTNTGADPAFLELDSVGGLDYLLRARPNETDTQPTFSILGNSGTLLWGPGGSTAADTALSRSSANVLGTGDRFAATDGLTTKTKAGVPVDGDFQSTPADGTIVVDTTSGRLWIRTGGAWKPLPGTTTLGADVANSGNNTYADITGLSVPVVNGVATRFSFYILWDAAAATTGARFSLNGPTNTRLTYQVTWNTTATTMTTNLGTGYDFAFTVGTASNTTNNIATIDGVIVPSASGNLIARFASEVSGSAVTAKAGSSVMFW